MSSHPPAQQAIPTPVAPPTPQEIHRKLSLHSAARPKIPTPNAGTESDSDSVFSPEYYQQLPPSLHITGAPPSLSGPPTPSKLSAHPSNPNSTQPPLGPIKERHNDETSGRAIGGGDSDDEEEEEGERGEGWRAAGNGRDSASLSREGGKDIKAGYLWKKGERRKTWKRRWFVLRPAHLAYYKDSAEYKLHRLLDLTEVHSCTPVELKKHDNTFGVVSNARTFYLQAESHMEMLAWVAAIREAMEVLVATSTQNSVEGSVRTVGGGGAAAAAAAGGGEGATGGGPGGISVGGGRTAAGPIPIPRRQGSRDQYGGGQQQRGNDVPMPLTPSPPSQLGGGVTSSESDDASPNARRMYGTSSSPSNMNTVGGGSAISAGVGGGGGGGGGGGSGISGGKAVVSGYVMKCGSKRRNWRKRWFVLNGEKLMYSGSHMDTKPHRQIPLSQILDAFEYDLPTHNHSHAHTPSSRITTSSSNPLSPPITSPPHTIPTASASQYTNNHTTTGTANNARTANNMEDMDPSSLGQSGAEHDNFTFKIVTTKRTLLLCAPSEEEEIKWLSAVKALIARRSEAGGVPGNVQSKTQAAQAQAQALSSTPSGGLDSGHGYGHGQSASTGSGSGSGSGISQAGSTTIGAGAGLGSRGGRKVSLSGGMSGSAFSPQTPIREESSVGSFSASATEGRRGGSGVFAQS
ncbi:PH-domain-containing protein [Stereum hirsutum FP-91666 SS1]|uniref:PH-domain-containing protein n=1 Tax=Stereum hirsutum (strain FP-91666) TaxID=721885 RepID=UPI000440EF98|nr:PH-domain-containing protein [Stereum hirsutum FP-91666 SS1]EIM91490.1 PH-domain-containing protein [Stereum hirsutum FP-91666 SS1]